MPTSKRPAPCDLGSDYLYHSQAQLNLPGQLPSTSHPYTVTPPESLASGVREFGHEDVGRLSDVLEEDGERLQNIDQDDVEIKDVVLLEEIEQQASGDSSSSTSMHMVNVRPNKISSYEGETRDISRGPPLSVQTFLKERMRDIFVDISTTGNMAELLVLEGANGGVVIHKGIISAYSKLIKQQLEAFPDCTTVFLPSYSQKILRKVVEILYTGETFYSEDEKKDVNLIWEAMRQLQISFDDKSFYYHPVECTVVKEDCEDNEDQSQEEQQEEPPAMVPESEIDQTDECWHETIASTQNTKSTFSYCRVVRRPHPTDPARTVYVQSNCGEGKRIQRSLPAAAHVNEEENKEKERLENIRQAKIILSKHKPVIVDLVDDSDDDCPSPNKKTRTETFAADTTVIRDESFKKLVASGQVSLEMVRAAALGTSRNPMAVARISVEENPKKLQQHNTHQESCGTADEASEPSGSPPVRVPCLTIPPNRPAGTSITFMNTSPKAKESASTSTHGSPTREMPKLRAVDEVTPGVRVRRKSHDIVDIPKLDKAYDDTPLQQPIKDECGDNECNDHVITELPVLQTAAVVPAAKVKHLTGSQRPPFAVNSDNSQPMPSCSGYRQQITNENKLRKRNANFLDGLLENADYDIQQLREAYQKELHEKTKKPVVIGSTKIPLPDNVTVDAYVENLQDGESDEVAKEVIEKELNLGPVSTSVVTTQGDVYDFLNDFVSTRKLKNKTTNGAKAQKTGIRGSGRRGRGRGAKGTDPAHKGAVPADPSELIIRDQITPRRGTARGRGGRRGCRRGGVQ